MMTILMGLIGLALLATVVVLGLGISSMGRGGKFDEQHEVQFMSARVGLQALTIVLLVIAAYMAAS